MKGEEIMVGDEAESYYGMVVYKDDNYTVKGVILNILTEAEALGIYFEGNNPFVDNGGYTDGANYLIDAVKVKEGEYDDAEGFEKLNLVDRFGYEIQGYDNRLRDAIHEKLNNPIWMGNDLQSFAYILTNQLDTLLEILEQDTAAQAKD